MTGSNIGDRKIENIHTLVRNCGVEAFKALLLSGITLLLPVDPAAARDSSPEEQENVGVEAENTIIVTARQREEALTEVPVAITSYSSDFLAKQNISSFTDYATKVPNLSFQYGAGGSLLWAGDRETTIRGIVGNGTTAYYINDTPVPASVTPQVLNLDRIEVLKGPQGTLFGASSMGGNLRFITKKPSLAENSSTIEVQGGSTKGGDFDFAGNGQTNIVLVPDRVALDVAFGYTHDSGFITRRFPSASGGGRISRDDQGRSDVFSGSLSLRIKLSDALEATIGALGQTTDLHGFPSAYVPLPAYEPLSYVMDREQDIHEYSNDRWGLGSFVLNYAGEGFSVVSSTSYFARRIRELEDDTEGTRQLLEDTYNIDLGNAAFYFPFSSREKRFTQETRLSFDDGTIVPGISGIGGIFYQHQSITSRAPAIFVQELADLGLSPPYLNEGLTFNRGTDFALFGELYYEIIPKLTLTLGLRQYWNRREQDASVTTGFIVEGGLMENPAIRSTQSGLVPKAVLSYAIGDQGNVYLSAAKGFRAGGNQTRLPDICTDDLARLGLTLDNVGQYRSDSLWSYEIGAKSRLAGGRLSASVAAFRVDWSDIQQTALLQTCALPFTANAGKARIKGGELEIGGRPFAGVPLSIQLGIGYTDAKLIDPGVFPQVPNSRLGLVPKWTASFSGYYEAPIKDEISLFVAADYSYTSSVEVADGADGFYARQPINMVNGNFGINFVRSQIMIYVKNLLDKRLNYGDQPSAGFDRQDESGQRLPRGVVSRPRQFGIQYNLEF